MQRKLTGTGSCRTFPAMSEPKRSSIVTGAAHGIGRAIALRLVSQKWRVLAVDVNADGLEEMAGVPGMEVVRADVSREEEIGRVMDLAMARSGTLDAIISNAGISEFKSLAESTLDDWNRVLSTNLTATFLLARAGEKLLREAKGSMVLISSTRAHRSEPDTHAYAASKGGLVALAHSLAISLAPDVRVNCISPGWIDVSDDELSAEDHLQHPAGRVGRPDDIAAAVSFLLSDDAGFVTGAEWIIDGGMTRKMIYR